MNLNQIKAFLSAADTLSFTRAAEALYTSQQSVSNQIINLEQDLGCALFVRHNNTLVLTDAGTRYYQVFSRYLHQGSELLAQIHKDKDQRDHHLRLGISMWLDAAGTLAELLGDYEAAYPGITVEAIQDHNRALLSKLKHQELDIILLSDWQPLGDPDVVCRAIARQEVCLYVPSDIPDATPNPNCWGLSLYHPASWDFGFFESERILEQRFSALGLTPKHAMACPNLETLRLMLTLTRCAVLSENQLSFGDPSPGYRAIPLHETACYCVRHVNNVSKIAENFTQFASNYFYDSQSGAALSGLQTKEK